jgi:hypothetical protein
VWLSGFVISGCLVRGLGVRWWLLDFVGGKRNQTSKVGRAGFILMVAWLLGCLITLD